MTSTSDGSPYLGLRPYDIADAPLFFGRARESWELTSLLLSSRLVVVYGPSGVGKTSLLHAGVLAGLGEGVAQVLPTGRPASTSALPRAAAEGNPFTYRLLSSWAPEDGEAMLHGRSVADFLRGQPVEVDLYGEELPMVAIIDQFEEIFTDIPLWRAHREDFLQQLGAAVETIDRLRLVVSLREDMVGEILPYESTLSRSNRTRFRVRPLDRVAALEAVTGPLVGTRRSFAPGVAEMLVDRLMTVTFTSTAGESRTVRTDAVEPISLQVICSALWRALPEDVTHISSEHVQDHGDVAAALGEHCANAVAQVAEQRRLPEAQLWEWLDRTFVTDLGTRNTAYEGVDTTGGMPNAVARLFEEHRLLRSERRSGSVWFELLHDGLIEPMRAGRARALDGDVRAGRDPRPDTYLSMAESALAYGMSPLAEELAVQAADVSGDDPATLAEVMSLLAKLIASRGQAEEGDQAEILYASAEEHYRRAMQLFEIEQNFRAVAHVLASLGRLFLARGRVADATSMLQSAVTRLPGDAELHLDLARALEGSGQAQAALGQYESSLVVAPDSVDALLGRAALQSEHDPAAALRDLDRAVDIQPDLADRADVVEIRARALARLQTRA
jgi:Flp pilus assembly protein TadD